MAIPQTFDEAFERAKQLVSIFSENEGKYLSPGARSEGDKTFHESKCATLDRQIDQLVYELYELTPDEIAIVESAASK